MKASTHRPVILAWSLGVPLGLLLLLALLLVIIDVFDRQLVANPLSAMVEDATGRQLNLDGFDLRWGWPVSVYAEDISLANAPWGADTPMLEVGAVSVSINPLQLLEGPPYAHIQAETLNALIERSMEGQLNWQMDMAEAGEEEAARGFTLPVTVLVDGGHIRYQEATGPREEMLLQRFSIREANAGNEAGNEEGVQNLAVEFLASSDGIPLEIHAGMEVTSTNTTLDAALLAGDSRADLYLQVFTSEQPIRLRGSIDSELLDPAELTGIVPEGDPEDASETIVLPAIDNLDADIDITVGTLLLGNISIENVSSRITVREGRLLLPLQAQLESADIAAIANLDTLAPQPELVLEASMSREQLEVISASLPLPDIPGEIEGQILASLRMPDSQFPMTPAAVLARLVLPEGHLVYSLMQDGVEVMTVAAEARVEAVGGAPEINLLISGPEVPALEATMTSPPVRELFEQTPYLLELDVIADMVQAHLQAELGELLAGGDFSLAFSAMGDGLPPMPPLGFIPPPLESFEIAGSLQREAQRWSVAEMQLVYGESRLTGTAVYSQEEARPWLGLDLDAELLDLTAFQDISDQQPATGNRGWIPANIAESLRAMDGGLNLSARQIQLSDTFVIEQAELVAELETGQVQIQPFGFQATGGAVTGNLTLDLTQALVSGQLNLAVAEFQPGQLSAFISDLEAEPGLIDGELHVAFSEVQPDPSTAENILSTLGHLSLDGTRVRYYSTPGDTDFSLRVAQEGAAAEGARGNGNLLIEGDGQLMGEPAQLSLQGDSLQALRQTTQPYNLGLELSLASMEAALEGQVSLGETWMPEALTFSFSAADDAPARLEPLLAPFYEGTIPPYRISGSIAYEEDSMILSDLNGTLGASDIEGNLAVSSGEQPLRVSGNLHSNRLVYEDFQGLMGPAEEDPNGEASPEGNGSQEEQGQRLFPQSQFDLAAMDTAEIDLQYQAEVIEMGGVPLDSFEVDVQFHDGQLLVTPLRLGIGGGSLQSRIDMRVLESRLEGLVEMEMQGLDLGSALAEVELAAGSFGRVGGEGKFWMRGDSAASLMASLDGGLMLLMTGGALDALLVELAGLDLGEALLVADGEDAVAIDCAFASLHSEGGVMDVDRFIFDTSDTTFFIEGSVDLRQESLDLTFYSEAKDASLLTAASPVEITGPFLAPEVDVLTEGLIARGLESLALSVIATPVAALLPFLEPGLQEEPEICQGWVDEIEEEV